MGNQFFLVPIENRLESKALPITDCGCLVWMGATTRKDKGYGLIAINGKKRKLAHILAYELKNGPIPEGMKVLHKCDISLCVNPNHLYLGTQADNVKDMCNKNRKVPACTYKKRRKSANLQHRDIYGKFCHQKTHESGELWAKDFTI